MEESGSELLDGVRLLITENDFETRDEMEAFEKRMREHGFVPSDVIPNVQGVPRGVPGPGWSSGPRGLKDFVTIWRRDQ